MHFVENINSSHWDCIETIERIKVFYENLVIMTENRNLAFEYVF